MSMQDTSSPSGPPRPSASAGLVRLSQTALHELDKRIKIPSYDRTQIRSGIVHIGVGAFHRAHMAVYIDDLLNAGVARDWGIVGSGLLPYDQRVRDALMPQDYLYTVHECSATSGVVRVIGSLTDCILGREAPTQLIAKLAAPSTRIVSLTVTEAGYCLDETTGGLDVTSGDVVHDLAVRDRPRGLYGFLCTALQMRRRANTAPFTVLSCDNAIANGDLIRRGLLAFADACAPGLSSWLDKEGAFPNSVMDRITPATIAADRHFLADYGLRDAWPVRTESFRQWIIEDKFSCGRPPLEAAGAQLVADVIVYEAAKIRLLNATHSAVGYLACLAGFQGIAAVVNDSFFRRFARAFMDEDVTPTLAPIPGIDIEQYKATILERFSNRHIGDTVARICKDGSAKIPRFVLPILRDQLRQGGSIRWLCLAIAGWCRYLEGRTDDGQAIVFDDPRATELTALAQRSEGDVRGLLGYEPVFGRELGQNPRFVEGVATALKALRRRGAVASIASCLEEPIASDP